METTTTISIPFPEEESLHLRLALGACRLRIRPGEGSDWVSGTYHDPSEAMPLRVVQEGGSLKISQEFHWSESLGLINEPPTVELALGTNRPYSLKIEGGASECFIDLGGVPLLGLDVNYGAGRQQIDFSAPNPRRMEKLSLAAGAASVEFLRLANANVATMEVEGGAARFALDFAGELTRDAQVKVSTGMASVELMLPPATAARVDAETVMGGLDVGDGWMKREGMFMNEAALAGGEPAITISARVVMGAIRLVTA